MRSKPLASPCSVTTRYVHHAYKLPLWCTSCSSHQDRLARGRNGGVDPVQKGPDRILESRGLLEGQLKKLGANFGSQGGCNSSVVVRAAHVLFIYRLGGRTWWC
jgi:hypothetical protein